MSSQALDLEPGDLPFPLVVLQEIVNILDASRATGGKSYGRTLASLAIASKVVRSVALETLWTHQKIDDFCIVSAPDSIPFARCHSEIVTCPNAIHHPGFLYKLEPYKNLKTWTIAVRPNDAHDCVNCQQSLSTTISTPFISRIDVVNAPNLRRVNLVYSKINDVLWSQQKFIFETVEFVAVLHDSTPESNLAVTLEGVSKAFPKVKTLLYQTYQDQEEDELRVLLTHPSPSICMSKLERIHVIRIITLPLKERLLMDRKGNLTVSGPRNHLKWWSNPTSLTPISYQNAFTSALPTITDKSQDSLHAFRLSLQIPSLNSFTFSVRVGWQKTDHGPVELYTLALRPHMLTHHAYHQLTLPREEEAVHPDGSLGCDVPASDGTCHLAEKLTNGEAPGKYFCQACHKRMFEKVG